MYKIAICDDEAIFADFLAGMTKNILKELDILYSIDLYDKCETLLEVYKSKPEAYDLLLLDILMEGMNGMELAEKIREVDQDVVIVFTTSTKDFSIQGYEVRAFQYLLKPVKETALREVLHYANERKFMDYSITIKQGTFFRKLPAEQIIYLETQGRKVSFYLNNEVIPVSGKLTQWFEKLPENDFIRCHQSFIININHIIELKTGNALSDNGKLIPVSRAYQRSVQKAFLTKISKK
ncbi:MAG: LytTR family DNA-binding domain-containing protein [Anaerocolumna sp.]